MLGTKRPREETPMAPQSRSIRRMITDLGMTKGSPHEMMKLSEMLQARSSDGIDQGYIKTLLFPELYNADIPQPMSTQSYCRFTDKKELSISSGGEGMLIWYPRVNNGPSVFIKTGNNTTQQTADTDIFQVGDGANGWKAACFQNYSEYFSMTNLVAGSLSIQYIGQLQNEQGYMVGSQSYGISPDKITSDEVENGQFRALAKPGDGLRTTYLPKDMNDFTYQPCTQTKDKVAQSRNGTGYGGETVTIFPQTQSTVLKSDMAKYFINGVYPKEAPFFQGPATDKINGGPGQFVFTKDADFVCVYWKGLYSGNTNADLRIDIVRKFNGFPRAEKRDLLDLNKPRKIFDPKKTIDVIQELQSAIPMVVTHSLKQMDRVSDQIQEFIPNLGHLYNEGMLKEGTSLEGFAQQLQSISGQEGSSAQAPVRIYDA